MDKDNLISLILLMLALIISFGMIIVKKLTSLTSIATIVKSQNVSTNILSGITSEKLPQTHTSPIRDVPKTPSQFLIPEYKTCPSCNGKGHIHLNFYTCPTCNGSGIGIDYTRPCPSCSGEGKIRIGYVKDPSFGDWLELYSICPRCNGLRYLYITCFTCGGDGLAPERCANCGGTGIIVTYKW